LLESTLLDSISSFIVENAVDLSMDVRLEAYSCKMVNMDKREWKRSMRSQCGDGDNYTTGKSAKDQLQLLSPTPEDLGGTPSSSPVLSANSLLGGAIIRNRHLSDASNVGSDNDIEEGRLVAKAVSRRCLFNMVALLNLSYPDYDFLETKSDSFTSCTLEDCVANVNGKFFTTVSDYSKVRDHIWKAIDNEIKLGECTVYSYVPGYDSDSPFTEDGCIWSFNYLLFNQHLKRFLFFACRAMRPRDNCADASYITSEALWDIEVTE